MPRLFRIRISRISRGKERMFTAFGDPYTSKRKAHEQAMRLKRTMGVTHVSVKPCKTGGNLRGVQHKFPLSKFKTQTQRGTAPKRTW